MRCLGLASDRLDKEANYFAQSIHHFISDHYFQPEGMKRGGLQRKKLLCCSRLPFIFTAFRKIQTTEQCWLTSSPIDRSILHAERSCLASQQGGGVPKKTPAWRSIAAPNARNRVVDKICCQRAQLSTQILNRYIQHLCLRRTVI